MENLNERQIMQKNCFFIIKKNQVLLLSSDYGFRWVTVLKGVIVWHVTSVQIGKITVGGHSKVKNKERSYFLFRSISKP